MEVYNVKSVISMLGFKQNAHIFSCCCCFQVRLMKLFEKQAPVIRAKRTCGVIKSCNNHVKLELDWKKKLVQKRQKFTTTETIAIPPQARVAGGVAIDWKGLACMSEDNNYSTRGITAINKWLPATLCNNKLQALTTNIAGSFLRVVSSVCIIYYWLPL